MTNIDVNVVEVSALYDLFMQDMDSAIAAGRIDPSFGEGFKKFMVPLFDYIEQGDENELVRRASGDVILYGYQARQHVMLFGSVSGFKDSMGVLTAFVLTLIQQMPDLFGSLQKSRLMDISMALPI